MTQAQYLDAKLELEKNIRDEYKTQIDLRKEQNELIKDGYRAQKEALDKILEKKKKSLDYDLSEYNYRKNIAEKTKSITDLEKQLAMLQGDNSEEAKAKRQQIEVQLKENKKVAKLGGEVAKNTRKDIEEKLGETVVSKQNFLDYEYIEDYKKLESSKK